MRSLLFSVVFAASASTAALAGGVHHAPRPGMDAACGSLSPRAGQIAYAVPEASACCADAPACPRLLATTIIRRPAIDPRT